LISAKHNVPYKEPKIEKVFYTIGEMAEMFHVNASLIRYWDKEFSSLTPTKNKKGNRLFTPRDVEHFRLIYHLLKEKGMTIKGARQLLNSNKEGTSKIYEAVIRLQQVKEQLIAIRDEMEELPNEEIPE
jgi:DNA-binding transcriptional MerR regulator